ncbi:hypothetical protein EVAR_44172_1 [Eumeta japonica]|uniref:Uncharacterized protein n=1 Tax=Eumeta variegata TaxID=151549 RepID=A0A4C1W385_EUMVA|nr:hypothetical protein EVAR_44172_1 [Eumeta japonica]
MRKPHGYPGRGDGQPNYDRLLLTKTYGVLFVALYRGLGYACTFIHYLSGVGSYYFLKSPSSCDHAPPWRLKKKCVKIRTKSSHARARASIYGDG